MSSELEYGSSSEAGALSLKASSANEAELLSRTMNVTVIGDPIVLLPLVLRVVVEFHDIECSMLVVR